jgi:hypothetical protein
MRRQKTPFAIYRSSNTAICGFVQNLHRWIELALGKPGLLGYGLDEWLFRCVCGHACDGGSIGNWICSSENRIKGSKCAPRGFVGTCLPSECWFLRNNG